MYVDVRRLLLAGGRAEPGSEIGHHLRGSLGADQT